MTVEGVVMNRFVLVAAILLLTNVSLASYAANENTLARRGFLGASLDVDGGAADRGVRVREIFPDSSAQAAGLQPEDVLLRLNEQTLEGPGRLAAAVQEIGRVRGGQVLDATILRDDAELSVPVTLRSLPEESSPNYDTVYDAVDVDGVQHRVVLTMPRGEGPHPAMFFIQGLGCSSVEYPLQPMNPIRQLIDGVTRADFATLRVEKSGCGDSQGPPCEEIDLQTELKAYRAALDYAIARDGIDASRVYLFGHSMGGVFAPLLAAERPVAGIIVYGTIGVPLGQYFLENDARQMPMQGYTGGALERQLELAAEFVRLFVDERLTPAQVVERAPELRGFMRFRQADDTHIFYRHYTFWQQLAELKLPLPWEQVNTRVLALWGTSDVAATRGDHPLIVDTVNARHPGLAEFRELTDTGHGFEKSPSMADSLRNRMDGEFNPLVVSTCVEWMKGVNNKG